MFMYRRVGAMPFGLFVVCLTWLLATPSVAAESTCAFRWWDHSLEYHNLTEYAGALDANGKSKLCRSVLISGTIAPGDAAKFEAWLAANPFIRYVYLRSPGGDIDAAMKIGRNIRSRFISTHSERHETERGTNVLMEHERKEDFPHVPAGKLADCRETGCCLSACVLILAAGASFEPGNIGLHRPSAKDFAISDYASVRERLENGVKQIHTYLSEMEISPRLYEAMMSVPSDELLLFGEKKALPLMTGMHHDPNRPATGVAPSIYEWAKPRCEHESGSWRIGNCIHHQIFVESVHLSKVRVGPPK